MWSGRSQICGADTFIVEDTEKRCMVRLEVVTFEWYTKEIKFLKGQNQRCKLGKAKKEHGQKEKVKLATNKPHQHDLAG